MFKRGKFIFLVIFFLVFLVGYVNATNITSTQRINETSAYDWLYDQMNSSGWNKNPSEIALSILALGGKGYNVSDGIDKLKDLESDNNWGNGDIKDTSLAILALYNAGENVSEEIKWLKEQHKKAMTDGTWYIQLDSSYIGTMCTLKYGNDEFEFEVNGTNVIQTNNDYCTDASHWINFVNCVKREDVGISEEIGVRCDRDTSSSIIFQSPENEYFIVDEGEPLNIQNGCFYWRSSCDCDYSGYAAWVLKEVGAESFVKPYMMYKCAGAKGYSFLYIITDDPFYSDWLESNQQGGSWDGKLRTTYLALLALKKYGKKSDSFINDAISYIEYYQDNDGSWNQNIEDTAFILYILYSGDFRRISNVTSRSVCGDGLIQGLEDCEGDDLNNKTCRSLGFDSGNLSCNSDCTFDTTGCVISGSGYCGDGDCGLGETCSSCEIDCGSCNGTGSTQITCPSGKELNPVTGQCEKKSSWLKWLVVILSVILGVVVIYYVYTKYFKRKRGGKEQSPITINRPPFRMTRQNIPIKRQPVVSPVSSRREAKIERELEESLKRARELLKK
jgi:hypothetical protein